MKQQSSYAPQGAELRDGGFPGSAVGRPRVALVRGRYLNLWEGQTFAPLLERFEMVGITSHRPDFDLSAFPFATLPLFAPDQRVTGAGFAARVARRAIARPDEADTLRDLPAKLRDFQLAHAADTHLGFSAQAAEARLSYDVPLVVTCWENIPFNYYDDPVLRARKMQVRRAADRFLAVTDSAIQALRLEGVQENRIRRVMPGVDLARFTPGAPDRERRNELGVPEDGFLFLYVGRLIREKGLLYLFLAARQVIAETEGRARFALAGTGAYREALEAIANELGIRENVLFPGSVPYAELPALYHCADAFVLPSVPTPYWQEQYGMVLAEAMACGRPVVATRMSAIPDVTGDAALLVDPYDAPALARAMLRLIREKSLREEMAGRARARAESCFDTRRTQAQIAETYDEILTGH